MTDRRDQILPKDSQIGVYEIKDTLKISTFDITYRAWNHHLKERVEIQEYFPHDLAIRANGGLNVEPKSPEDKENFEYGLKAFLDQAEALAQIKHPNVAAVENILQLNGTAYLIMIHQEGVPLSRLIQSSSSSMAEAELKFILVSILRALEKVHECKIVHGGIQPATILLSRNGEPILTHFAAAHLAIAARTSQIAGELAAGYAPAEQYKETDKVGPATDFYALGATMYYCMTRQQPVDAQSRIMALSNGEPDPMATLSGSAGTAYSAELQQAVKWMLRPDYNDRPQSAAEILALLKPEYAEEPGKAMTSQQKATADAKHGSVDKSSIGAGVVAGIIALVAVGVWYGEKNPESLDDQSATVIAQFPSEHDADQAVAAHETPEEQTATLAFAQPSQESDPGKISQPASGELSGAEKQPQQASGEMPLQATTDDHQHDNQPKEPLPESMLSSASVAMSGSGLKDKPAAEPEPVEEQQQAVIEPLTPQPESQQLPEKSIDEKAVKVHLTAAEKAMKAVRYTTPQKDNAYQHYQKVLAIDPDNAEALAGLQKIVDRYVQFIAKARIDGRLDEARLYLQRAESVLPNDPKLASIRAELAVAKKN